MKKTLSVTVLIGCLLGLAVDTARAGFTSDLSLQSVGTMVGQYGGDYVGPIMGNITGGSTLGFVCDDYSTTTYVPANYQVYVGTLGDLSLAKFGPYSAYPLHFTNINDAVAAYEKAAWLLGQMKPYAAAGNVTEVGKIQFAIWSIFDPATPSDRDQADWLRRAGELNLSALDFNSVRLYTATTSTNQEFMTGAAASVPVPSTLILLGPALMVIGAVRKRA